MAVREASAGENSAWPTGPQVRRTRPIRRPAGASHGTQRGHAVNISEICIRRPVFTWVLVGIPVVMGAVAYFELGVDLFPKVDFPVVAVTATLPGTSPEEMETSVTRHIEEAVNTVSGVDELHSTVAKA